MKRLVCGAAGALALVGVVMGMAVLPPPHVARMAPLGSVAHPAYLAQASAVSLLPGEVLWNGVPSFNFGANDGVNWDTQYNMDVPPDGPAIQSALKAAGMPIARVWFFQNSLVDNHPMTDAEQLQKVQAVKNSGMVCFANLPTENTVAYDLHMLDILGTACPYVEVMNEPDIETAPWNGNKQIDPTAYLSFWNSFVPQARAAHPGLLFGGPADYDNQGNYCTYNNDGTSACFLQKVMMGMKSSGNLPDFVTYHWYPCWNNTADECLALASSFKDAAAQVIGWANSIFGRPMPVICSEWNADPGSPDYMNNRTWDAQFVTAALRSIEQSGLAGAMEYDISQYGNYGADDLFDIYNGGKPFATFTAFAAEIARVRNGSPVTPPTPTPTPMPTARATATPRPPTATPAPGQTPGAATTATGASAQRTPTPIAAPPADGPLSLLQSLSAFSAGTLTPGVAFARPVSAHDGLIATVAMVSDGAGKPGQVASVKDTLGNTWARLASGTTTDPTGDELAAEIWFAPTSASGADTVTATLTGGGSSGSMRVMLTVAEVRGPVAPDGGVAAPSEGTRHVSGDLAVKSGEMLVGVFVSTGDDRGTAIGDGKAELGMVCPKATGIQSAQSYGSGMPVVFTTASGTTGEVVIAALGT